MNQIAALREADISLLKDRWRRLKLRMTPCPPQRQAALLAGMAAVMPSRPGDELTWKLRAAIYTADTAEYPEDILDAALVELRRDFARAQHPWLPSIAELRGVCDRLLQHRLVEIQRLEMMFGDGPKALPPAAPRPPRTPERQAEITALIANLRNGWKRDMQAAQPGGGPVDTAQQT